MCHEKLVAGSSNERCGELKREMRHRLELRRPRYPQSTARCKSQDARVCGLWPRRDLLSVTVFMYATPRAARRRGR